MFDPLLFFVCLVLLQHIVTTHYFSRSSYQIYLSPGTSLVYNICVKPATYFVSLNKVLAYVFHSLSDERHLLHADVVDNSWINVDREVPSEETAVIFSTVI